MTARPHTHESPRDVLLKTARDGAVICRRHGDEERARLWDLEAAKLEGHIDSPADMHRRLAEVYESGGAHVVARQHRAMAVAYERVTAADAEAAAAIGSVPVDGREVDRAPDVLFTPAIPADMLPPPQHVAEYRLDDYRETWYCRCPILTDHMSLTPRSGDEAGGSPPAEPANPPSGPASSPPQGIRHLWLRVEDSRQWEDCWCLIGDDHVAEPRFEKES